MTKQTGPTCQKPAPPAPVPARPPRRLTIRQHQALETFVRLGGRLTPDSTITELRSAFRTLALAYHPDRHPGGSEDEKARLTRILADLNEHHQHLIAAFRSAA